MQAITPSARVHPTAAVNLRRFYETQPYPCTGTELACLIEGRQAVVGDPERWFHLYFPDQPYREGLQALVVGCRNLEAARLAAGASRTRFVAVDQDETALDQLDRFKQHYRLDNLELMWLGADQIPVIDRQFDLVFCPQGPMPPLAPAEFLRLVRSRLTPSGSVALTVGGRHGRLGVMLFRRLLETVGLDLETTGAATIRQWAAALPPAHPFRVSVADLPEAASDEGLAELLQTGEPAFSIPELGTLLAESGLHLQRFLCQAHYMPQCSGISQGSGLAAAGGAPRANAVDAGTDGYEEPGRLSFAIAELLRGNLREHIVIACRDDRPAASYKVSFGGPDWVEYKAHRNPGLEIEAGPFPGDGVARLSWAAHENPEISLIVDEKRARLFDLIDGERSIGGIIEAAGLRGVNPEELARDFFHALWLRDYAWFQIPAASAGRPAAENFVSMESLGADAGAGPLAGSASLEDSISGENPFPLEQPAQPEVPVPFENSDRPGTSPKPQNSVQAETSTQAENSLQPEPSVPKDSAPNDDRDQREMDS